MKDWQPASMNPTLDESQRLFMALTEELKVPFEQIERRAELAALNGHVGDTKLIAATADDALRLIDNYLLAIRLQQNPEAKFTAQPVSVAAILYDARAELMALANRYNVQLELDIAGKYGPVLAHDVALKSALTSLGHSLISALPAAASSKKLYVKLSAHRGPKSIVAGIYSDEYVFTPEVLRRGRRLYGQTRQPLTGISPHAGAGIFIADTILRAMSLSLKASKYHNQSGLATALPLSPQLQLAGF